MLLSTRSQAGHPAPEQRSPACSEAPADIPHGSVAPARAVPGAGDAGEASAPELQDFIASISRHVSGMFYQYRMAPDGSSGFPYVSDGIRFVYELDAQSVRHDAAAVFARLHPDDIAEIRATTQRSLATLTPWYQQYRVRLPQRGERWLETQATPQRSADGSVLWHGYTHDITTRRDLGRTQRDKLAGERSSRARGERLAQLGRSLQTQLRSVVQLAQALQGDAAVPPPAQSRIEQVRQAGVQMLAQIGAALEAARADPAAARHPAARTPRGEA